MNTTPAVIRKQTRRTSTLVIVILTLAVVGLGTYSAHATSSMYHQRNQRNAAAKAHQAEIDSLQDQMDALQAGYAELEAEADDLSQLLEQALSDVERLEGVRDRRIARLTREYEVREQQHLARIDELEELLDAQQTPAATPGTSSPPSKGAEPSDDQEPDNADDHDSTSSEMIQLLETVVAELLSGQAVVAWFDLDGDGVDDTVFVDRNDDGQFNAVGGVLTSGEGPRVWVIDRNFNGRADVGFLDVSSAGDWSLVYYDVDLDKDWERVASTNADEKASDVNVDSYLEQLNAHTAVTFWTHRDFGTRQQQMEDSFSSSWP